MAERTRGSCGEPAAPRWRIHLRGPLGGRPGWSPRASRRAPSWRSASATSRQCAWPAGCRSSWRRSSPSRSTSCCRVSTRSACPAARRPSVRLRHAPAPRAGPDRARAGSLRDRACGRRGGPRAAGARHLPRMQVLNVALGGSLHQHLPDLGGELNHRQEGLSREPSHRVTLARDSRLTKVIGRRYVEVNSYHHQALHALGRGLSVAGRSPDGDRRGGRGARPALHVRSAVARRMPGRPAGASRAVPRAGSSGARTRGRAAHGRVGRSTGSAGCARVDLRCASVSARDGRRAAPHPDQDRLVRGRARRGRPRAAALLGRPRHERDAQVDPGRVRGRGRGPDRQPGPARTRTTT